MKLAQIEEVDFFDSPAFFWCFLTLFYGAGMVLICVANGMCDNGDSTMHYLYARYAPLHPSLFFDHWAKPLYVLLASPAAQFGTKGIKLFNLTLSALAIFITWLSARLLQIKRASLVSLFMLASPALLVHSLSGLTEPLFAFVLVLSIYLYLSEAIFASILLLSFLPFVRSEGLIICGVFGFLLMLERRFWFLPLLAVGHLVFGLAGVLFHIYKSVFWVFTRIPYAVGHTEYGRGPWYHFIIHLPSIIGFPLCFLLLLGLLAGLVYSIKILRTRQGQREIVLVYGCFLAYFVSHSAFWALGIFHSYGMMRVLIGVLPLMALIEIRGFSVIWGNAFRGVIAGIILGTIIIFPFTKYGGWNYKNSFCLRPEAMLMVDAIEYIKSNNPEYKSCQYYFDSNYGAIALDADYFDTTKILRTCQISWDAIKPVPKGFLIWDDWYSAGYNTSLEGLKGNPHLKLIKEFIRVEQWGTIRKADLFETVNK